MNSNDCEASLTSLPGDAWLRLTTFLSPRDVASLSMCSKETFEDCVSSSKYYSGVLLAANKLQLVTKPTDFQCLRIPHEIRGKLITIGGAFSENLVCCYFLSNGNGTIRCETPYARDSFCSVKNNQFIYCFGGQTALAMQFCDVYDTILNSWSTVHLPSDVKNCHITSSHGFAIQSGGSASGYLLHAINVVFLPDLQPENVVGWRLTNYFLRAPRQHHSSVVFRGRLWVAGGVTVQAPTGEVTTNRVESVGLSELFALTGVGSGDSGPAEEPEGEEGDVHFNEVSPRGTPIAFPPYLQLTREEASLTIPRKKFELVATSQGLFAVGGDANCTIERYDPAFPRWELVSQFPQYRRLFSVVHGTRSNCLYIVGGLDDRHQPIHTVDTLSLDDYTWSTCTSVKSLRGCYPTGFVDGCAVMMDYVTVPI